jgi:hypothetical protein
MRLGYPLYRHSRPLDGRPLRADPGTEGSNPRASASEGYH